MRYHFSQPIGINDFDVVVEQEKDLSTRMSSSEINQATKIEFAGALDDSDTHFRRKAPVQFAGLFFDALIIDDDDLEI